MSLSIDHIVISVNDLEAAIKSYSALGFKVIKGGKHGSGITHNALIIFADGTYFELIAVVEGADTSKAEFLELIRQGDDEGCTGYALVADDLSKAAEEIKKRGIDVGAVRDGSRKRQDGIDIAWKMTNLDESRSPFMIEDVTERKLRVPTEEPYIQHDNGVLGISSVLILTGDLISSSKRYEAIIGSTAQKSDKNATFPIAQSTIILQSPTSGVERDYVKNYGSVPYEITLSSKVTGMFISAEDAHGARLRLVAVN